MTFKLLIPIIFFPFVVLKAQQKLSQNPIILADVPDMSMIRVGNLYYMSSTTMHLSPGIPIMKSSDLVNWQLVNYAYDTLANVDALNLDNGKNTYGRGSWASSLRYHNGIFYVTTFAQTTGKTYIYSTKNIENGPWKLTTLQPAYHDHSLFFDDDGRTYLLYGVGKIKLLELNADATIIKPNTTEQIIIENASLPAGNNIGLQAEGSQLFKINGKYFLTNIVWPRGGMRTVVMHRADKITGPWEGKLAFQDSGVAQGGMIDTPDGNWFAYLFRDYGSVGRIPYLVPIKWQDGWPVFGVNGKLPNTLNLPANKSLIPGIVASDNFSRKHGEPLLPLVWQWNHNPNNKLWTVTENKGFLRLKTGRIDTSFLMAKNTITQRTIGPVCTGFTCIHLSNMKDGDFAGLCLLQKNFGLIGVKINNGKKEIEMVNASSGKAEVVDTIALNRDIIFLKTECTFINKIDEANFYFSIDGKHWKIIGNTLKMTYTLPHFMGYRFGLFNYATKNVGGFADFDYFNIENKISTKSTSK